MMRPGDPARWIARRLLHPDTAEHVVESTLADMEWEHAHTATAAKWQRAKVLLAGHAALLRAVALDLVANGPRRTLRAGTFRTPAIVFSSCTFVIALLVMLPPLYGWRHAANVSRSALAASLIPGALGFALPLAFAVTAALSLGRRSRPASVLLRAAVLCMTANGFLIGWIVPRTNQAFRAATSGNPTIPRGPGEMTFSELAARARTVDARHQQDAYAQTYQMRLAWAFSPVPLALGFIGVACFPRRGVSSVAVAALYFAVLLGESGSVASVWRTQLACGLGGVLLALARQVARQPRPEHHSGSG